MNNVSITSIGFWQSFSYYLIYLPIVTGVFRFNRLSMFQKLVWALTCVTCISDSVTFVLRKNSVNNLWVYHVFVPVLLLIMTLAYQQTLASKWHKPLLYTGVLALLFSLINSIWIQPFTEFNSYAIVCAGVLFITFSILFFYQLLAEASVEKLGLLPEFWFNAGVLLHYSGTLILFLFVNYFLKSASDLLILSWGLNIFFTCLLSLSYTVTLWLKVR